MTATLATAALVLAACGGGDDEPAADDVPAANEAESDADDDASEAAPTGESADEEPMDEPAEPAEPAEEPAADEEPMDEPDDDDGDTIVVSSIDDVPEVCRELMADFLREIEPMVSPIDWDNATLEDFGTIAEEFDEISSRFDEASDAEEACDDIEMEDEDDFDLLIEFAGDVAPGTVGFMRFISGFAIAAGEMTEAGDDGGAMTGEAFSNCDEAIDWLRGLMDQYDSVAEVPVNEMMAFANIGTVMSTCTPEQLEVLNSSEFEEFMAGI